MNDYQTSLVRTAVPYLVGLVVSFLTTRGIQVDDQTAAALGTILTFVIGTLYYAVVRKLEKYKPKFGYLLGVAKKVKYTEPAKPAESVKG